MNQDLQNAMAFYEPAPEGDYSGVEGKWRWLWETLQGDFHENPTTAQTVTGAVITMIPLVDQIGDVRDLIANCKKIHKDSDDTWAWVALVLTLVGLFPTFGSLLKGCFKVLFFYLRKALFKAPASLLKVDAAVINSAITGLKRHLDNPMVRKVMAKMNVHNPFAYLADKLQEAKGLLTVEKLLEVFDKLLQVTRGVFDTVKKWVPQSVRVQIEQLWIIMIEVRNKADAGLAKALRPAQDLLDQLVNRLRVEGDNAYRARVGDNTHVLGQREAAELELIRRNKPDWVDKVKKVENQPLEELSENASSYISKGWPDISTTSKHPGLSGSFTTFDRTMHATTIAPGQRLYRVVDPSSGDNSICWMREAEFKTLNSKGQWRRELAVWKHWNENGEYIIYTVPPGQPLKVWEGRAGSQVLEADPSYTLEGGRVQVVLDPDELRPKFVSPRKKTYWGYDDGTGDMELDPIKPYLGLPELTHNWRMPENK